MTRSPWVRAALGLLGAVALVFAGVRVARVAVEGQFVKSLGPLEPAAYTRPPVKAEANAARYFLAAAGKLTLTPEEAKALAAANPVGFEGSLPAVEGLLARNDGALRLAKEGAGLWQSYYGLDYSAGLQTRLADMPQLVLLGRLLALEAQLATARRETGRLAKALSALGSLAASLEQEPGLTVFAAGLTLERWQLALLGQAASNSGLSRVRVASLVPVLSPINLPALFPRVVALEEASLRHALPEPSGLGQVLATDYLRLRSARHALQLAGMARQPCARWASSLSWSELDNHSARLLSVLAQAQGVTAARSLVRAALAASRHYAEHGALPLSLAVVPEASTPNPFTGEPLAFRRDEGVLEVPHGEELWRQLALPAPPPPFSVSLPLEGSAPLPAPPRP